MKGDELRAIRKRAGLKSYEIAETLGYTRQRWSAFERGHAPVPPVVEYATRWVCENRLTNDNPSLSAAERAVDALMEAMEKRSAQTGMVM